jgi:hypothetical protein
MAPLLIAIGNPLRGDDGVAWRLAEQAGRLRPAMAVRSVQQLTPELSAELLLASRLLFIDAWLAPGGEPSLAEPGPGPLLRLLTPWDAAGGPPATARSAANPAPNPAPAPAASAEPSFALPDAPPPPADPAGFSHALDPLGLLSFTQWLNGSVPPAWELLLPAWRFAHGAALSPPLRRQRPRALALLLQWCDTPSA